MTPPPTTHRLPGYDLARFVALFGMVVVDMVLSVALDFTRPGMVPDEPALLAWGQRMWWGRASVMLGVLAGTGLGLYFKLADDETTLARKRRTMLLRALFLLVVGHLWHSSTWWEFSILHYYAFFLAAGLLFVRSRPAVLLWTTGACLALSVAHELALGPPPGAPPGDFSDPLRLWDAAYWNPLRLLNEAVFDGMYPLFPWLGFLLIGMWTVRIGLDRREVRRRVLLGSLGACGASYLLWWLVRTSTDEPTALMLTSVDRSPSMPLYCVAAASQAIALICLCLAAAERWPSRGWMQPLIATGQMTFTIYIVRIFFGGGLAEGREGIFTWTGFPPGEGLVAGWLRVLVFLGPAILVCHLWVKRFGRGPLEALMRRCSDGARS